MVDSSGELEVTHCESAVVVCGKIQLDPVVSNRNVGVVICSFGQPRHLLHEGNSPQERFEDERSGYCPSAPVPPIQITHLLLNRSH